MTISYEERRKNSKLTQFDELREAVIANSMKATVPQPKKKEEENSTLLDF